MKIYANVIDMHEGESPTQALLRECHQDYCNGFQTGRAWFIESVKVQNGDEDEDEADAQYETRLTGPCVAVIDAVMEHIFGVFDLEYPSGVKSRPLFKPVLTYSLLLVSCSRIDT